MTLRRHTATGAAECYGEAAAGSYYVELEANGAGGNSLRGVEWRL